MIKRLIGILVILLSIQLVFAGVVSAKDLKKMSKSGDVVIVSARSASDYGSKHIKNAINLDHKDLYKADGVSSMLKSPAEIAKILGEKGISENSKIVIYDTGSNKAAGRLYWILKYMGADDVHILDGHLKGWAKVRGPQTSKVPKVEAVAFNAAPQADYFADMAYVKAHKDDAGVVLLDVRSADEFNGNNEDENLKRMGHIPGAINLEYTAVVNDDGTIKSKDEIAAVMKAAGVTSDKEVILYCATSVRAGIVFMALKDIMGYPNVKVYDGAYYEWESVAGNPVQ